MPVKLNCPSIDVPAKTPTTKPGKPPKAVASKKAIKETLKNPQI
jgi:hypothetical protein